MKTVKVLIALVASFFLSNVFAQTTSEKVDRPIFVVGDSWSYQNTDGWKNTSKKYSVVVKEVGSDFISLDHRNENSTTGTAVTTLEGNVVTRITVSGSEVKYSPIYKYFDFPLSVGKKWKASASFSTAGRQGSFEQDVEVLGWEKVKVPAGEFNALKISMKGYYNSSSGGSSGTGRMQTTYWYSTEVKGIVKSEYEDTNWSGGRFNINTIELMSTSLR